MNETSAIASTAPSALAKLRWMVPTAFLALTVWLLWHELGTFPLVEVQRALLDVPTLPALGVAMLAVFGVAFTGCVDFLIARWLSLGLHAGARERAEQQSRLDVLAAEIDAGIERRRGQDPVDERDQRQLDLQLQRRYADVGRQPAHQCAPRRQDKV